jgi:hypothetical protein
MVGFPWAARALLARRGVPAVPVRKKRAAGDEEEEAGMKEEAMEEEAGIEEEAEEDARTAQNTFRAGRCSSIICIMLQNVPPYTLKQDLPLSPHLL